MFYYMYQITNLVNNKIYVGVHKTKNFNDGYMGSGKVIKSAIKKHGILNFEKVILETFENSETMYLRESEIVNIGFLQRNDVYNIRCGGLGGFDHINDGSEEHRNRARRGAVTANSKMKNECIGVYSSDYVNPFSNTVMQSEICIRAQTPKARKKRIETLSSIKHQQGDKNSQFGKMWITDGIKNKTIMKSDLIPDGYRKGRIMGAAAGCGESLQDS